MDNKPYKKAVCIAAAVLAVAAVALVGVLITDTQSQWYQALKKPVFQPPDIVFSIVWIALYILIALSLVRLLTLNLPVKKNIWILYAVNGLLSVLWSFLFFLMQSPVLAFIVLLALAAETVFLLRAVWQKDALSGWLLVPYLIWLAFAAVLNYVIVMTN